jgi:hypothetical protein
VRTPREDRLPVAPKGTGGECGSCRERKALKAHGWVEAYASIELKRQESSKLQRWRRPSAGEQDSEGENLKGAWI